MKISISALLLSISISFFDNSFAQELQQFTPRYHILGNDTLPYQILLPVRYVDEEKYPLILFLHGAGERGSDNEKQLLHGSRLFLDPENQKKFPAIVLFPQCPLNDYWSSVDIDRTKSPLGLSFDYEKSKTRALVLVENLVEEVIRTLRVDERRIYVIGLSMGGMGAFEMVYRNPKRFAAAMPICGGGDAAKYSKKLRKTNFWIFHGEKDNVVDVGHSRAMVKRLKETGIPVKYSEYPGVNHNSWDHAFAEPGFLPWLFSNKRGPFSR